MKKNEPNYGLTPLGGSSYTYDSNGNLTSDGTRSFAYDDENQLVAVWVSNSWSNSFAYDGLLRKRIEQQYSYLPSSSSYLLTNEIHYIYDGNVVVEERDKNNEPLTTYTRGLDLSGTLQDAGGIGGLLARSDNQKIIPAILSPEHPNPQNVVTSFYFNDAQGNVIALVSAGDTLLAQYKYDPFGNLVSKSGPMADLNKYRFSSKEWEENAGLYYYGYRFYDANLQRWLNRDPNEEPGFLVLCNLGYSQASTDPLQSSIAGMNLYLYVKNNGLSFIDAEGLNFFNNIWQYLKRHAPPWSAPPPLPQGTGTVTLWFPPSPPGKHTFFCFGFSWSLNTNGPPPPPHDQSQSPWSRMAPPPLFPDH
jgi:RHS repeat-associated protein